MEKTIVEREYTKLLGDDDFDILAQLLRQPNIFDILKVTSYEIRHSNFLAWLLDPQETHGLGNVFLTKFLKDAFSHQSAKISVTDIVRLAQSKIQVYREWNSIDILLEFPNLVLVIENKVWSGEHDDQLRRYKELTEKYYNSHRHFFVFLTPYGQNASMPESYIDYSYKSIVKNLESLLRVNSTVAEKTRLYIDDYIKTIRRHFMHNSEANDLAKKIYYSHKNLFDFIISNLPNPIPEIRRAFENRLVDEGNVLTRGGGGYIRFLSKKLNELIPRDGGSNGWSSKEAFLFEIQIGFESSKIRIYCTLPPEPSPSKAMLKPALDTAFGKKEDSQWWIAYYDKQEPCQPLEIASQGPEAIVIFVDSVWSLISEMIRRGEEALIPLLTNKDSNEQLN